MKFKLFGRQITIGKDISQYTGRTDDLFSLFTQKYGVDYTVRNRLKAYKNIVFACSSLIGEALGDYQPFVQRRNGDQWETIDHEFLGLLKRPGGKDLKASSTSMFELFEATGIYQLLQGDCYWYMALGKTTNRPREIVILRPDKVGTDIDPKTGEVNGYFIRQSYGDPIPLEVNEVLRFPLFNPENPYKGKGYVEAGNDYIGTDESTAKYTNHFFGNNAGLSGVLNIKGEVTKGAFKKFVKAWRDKYEGVDNAGKVAILKDSEANFQKIGLGLNELDMTNIRKMSLDDVLMLFKVPMPLLGKAEQTGLGRANVEALEYIFAKYNIDKKMKRFDAVLQFALERYYGLDPRDYRIGHENIIPEDKEFELNERTQGVDKWIKRNEVRDDEGLDPVAGGDQLYVPVNMITTEEAGTPLEQPSSSASAGLTIKVIKRVKKTKELIRKGTSQGERFRLSIMRNQIRYEKLYRKRLKPIFKQQQAEALKNLEAHAGSITKANDQKYFDDSFYDNLMVEKLQPMLVDLAETQGGLALVFAGDPENEFHLTSNVESALKLGTRNMASNFNDETLDKLNRTLGEGISAGEGIGDLKKRVNSVYSDIDKHRAERIARTETLKASNTATLWAYKQTGYVTGKQWVVNPDACSQCAEFEGKTTGLDDTFLAVGDSYSFLDDNDNEQTITNSYDDIDVPPLHPNCRCTIIPTVGEIDDPRLLTSEGGFIGGDDEDNEEQIMAFHGDGQNVNNAAADVLGDAFYVSRSYAGAADYGLVSPLTLPFGEKQVLKITTDKQFEDLLDNAQKYGVEIGELDYVKYIPAYISHLGFKAAELTGAATPGKESGIAVVDKRAIRSLIAQMAAEGRKAVKSEKTESKDEKIKKLLEEKAEDKIYIQKLEKHLGVADEPEPEASETPKE